MKLSVVGTGYVGLVAGVCFADAGHSVICVDNNPEKIDALKKNIIPIYEPGLEELLKQCVKRETIEFSLSTKDAVESTDLIFVAVGTPEKEDGNADLGPTFSVLKDIAQAANGPKTVVLKSTIPVGTARSVKSFFKENCKHPISVVNNPEFLKEGAAIEDFLRPDRIVVGCDSLESRKMMEELYHPFTKNGHPIYFMDNTSAELTKYAANSFLSVKISFINEIAKLADKVGADINSVRKGFTSDGRINPRFFYPGVGFGGSCFPKDVQALIQAGIQNDVPMKIVQAAYDVNTEQKLLLVKQMKQHFGDLKDKTIALWGLSFKPKTDDVREAPALYIIEELTKLGAKVVAYDPIATENFKKACPVDFQSTHNAKEAVKGADALALVTEWAEFHNPDFDYVKKSLKSPVIFDGRNIYDPIKMKSLGFTYYCIGRQNVEEKI